MLRCHPTSKAAKIYRAHAFEEIREVSEAEAAKLHASARDVAGWIVKGRLIDQTHNPARKTDYTVEWLIQSADGKRTFDKWSNNLKDSVQDFISDPGYVYLNNVVRREMEQKLTDIKKQLKDEKVKAEEESAAAERKRRLIEQELDLE